MHLVLVRLVVGAVGQPVVGRVEVAGVLLGGAARCIDADADREPGASDPDASQHAAPTVVVLQS